MSYLWCDGPRHKEWQLGTRPSASERIESRRWSSEALPTVHQLQPDAGGAGAWGNLRRWRLRKGAHLEHQLGQLRWRAPDFVERPGGGQEGRRPKRVLVSHA